MITIEIYKDRNDNYYVQAGDYKVRIVDGTIHDGTTIGHFELVKKLTIHAVVGQGEQFCECDGVQDLIAGTGECRKCGGQCTY